MFFFFPRLPLDITFYFGLVWRNLTSRQKTRFAMFFKEMQRLQRIPSCLSMKSYIARNFCDHFLQVRSAALMEEWKWMSWGTDYQNPQACLHDLFLEHQEKSMKQAFEELKAMRHSSKVHEEILFNFANLMFNDIEANFELSATTPAIIKVDFVQVEVEAATWQFAASTSTDSQEEEVPCYD